MRYEGNLAGSLNEGGFVGFEFNVLVSWFEGEEEMG
jgi:hypothetical protein